MRGRGLILTALMLLGAAAAVLWVRGGADRTARGPGTPSQRGPDDVRDPDTAADAGTPLGLAAPPSGELVTVTLTGAPATHYAARADGDSDDGDNDSSDNDSGDAAYRELVEEVRDELAGEIGVARADIRFDRDLSRAAREVAYQLGVHRRIPPEAALAFLLHSSGAPESTASQFYTHTTSEQAAPLRDTIARALRNAPRGDGPIRVGVGEVWTPDQEYTRHIDVLLTRRPYTLLPTPRLAAPSATFTLVGTLPGRYADLSVSVLYPDGSLGEGQVERRGQRFRVSAPVGTREGTVWVDVGGAGPRGPGKIVQLSVEVGTALPSSVTVYVPEIEDEFESTEAAEAYALDLLNGDRLRYELPLLAADPALAAIARAHSEDMMRGDFFGHLSPTTGLVGDRLAAAGYRALAHAENLARNDTLGEAQAALMSSVGHRKNIVSDVFTHVGVGVARRADGDWFVTQVFATPVIAIDAAAAAAALLARLARARDAAGVAPVAVDTRLEAVAQRYARQVAGGAFEGLAEVVADDGAEASGARRVTVSVQAVGRVEDADVGGGLLDAALDAVGIGVFQSPDDSRGRTGVVILGAQM